MYIYIFAYRPIAILPVQLNLSTSLQWLLTLALLDIWGDTRERISNIVGYQGETIAPSESIGLISLPVTYINYVVMTVFKSSKTRIKDLLAAYRTLWSSDDRWLTVQYEAWCWSRMAGTKRGWSPTVLGLSSSSSGSTQGPGTAMTYSCGKERFCGPPVLVVPQCPLMPTFFAQVRAGDLLMSISRDAVTEVDMDDMEALEGGAGDCRRTVSDLKFAVITEIPKRRKTAYRYYTLLCYMIYVIVLHLKWYHIHIRIL